MEALKSHWFDHGSMETRYGDDPWFVQRLSGAERLGAAWEGMERSLRTEARFINPRAEELLDSVFGPLLGDRTAAGEPVIIEATPEGRLNSFYRARVFQTVHALESAMSHPERGLGPPPPGVASAGRMNAKGVSVFYGATHPDIAVAEVRPPVGSLVAIGPFRVTRPLRLVDLNRLRSIQLDPDLSFFDPATVEKAVRCQFLNSLERNLMMPVMPEVVDEGYLVTQVIADYLATHPILDLDGILFRSVQIPNTPGTPDGHNVILFKKAFKVMHSEERAAGSSWFALFEHDEDGIRMEPQLSGSVRPPETTAFPYMPDQDGVDTALELDRSGLEIREISGVHYHSHNHKVDVHHPRTPNKPPKY